MTPVMDEATIRALHLLRTVSAGDFEARARVCDLQGPGRELLLSLNDFVDLVDAYVRESQASMQFASQGKFFRRMMEQGLSGAFGAGARVSNEATIMMEKQSNLLAGARQERAQLADAITSLSEQMVESSVRLRDTAEKLSYLQSQSVTCAAQVLEGADSTSHHIQTIAAATEELGASILEIERNFGISLTASEQAGDACSEARHSMQHLAESSQAIDSVVRNIGHVASQTRMLALNANIEAARAGELGRGFAVVASEVKGLANHTQAATEDIQSKITRVHSATQDALKGTERVGQSVENIRRLAIEVRDQLQFQRSATGEISQSLHQASSLSLALRQSSDEVTRACGESREAALAVLDESARVAGQAAELQNQSQKLLMKVKL